MADNREKLYILCGLAGKGEDDIRNALTEKAEVAGYEAVCVSRYRKAGIRQYIAEHPEFRIVLLQESMQSSYPYTAEELAELMDDYNLNIIVSLSKSHRAKSGRYSRFSIPGPALTIFCHGCNIRNCIFLRERRITKKRNSSQSRECLKETGH